MNIVQLLIEASWVVQAVVLILMLVSVKSWTAIFQKWILLRKVKTLNEDFESKYRKSEHTLNEMYAAAKQNDKKAGPMEHIFAAGMREFKKLQDQRITDSVLVIEGTRRAMVASLQREMDTIESDLSMLASVGSVSPYVGLFGTVWGIMHAFTGLAALQQVTLAKVAPGIAEALVTTAIGLFAAIPAVLAFNRFSRDIDRIANNMETFIEEFSNTLQRSVVKTTTATK